MKKYQFALLIALTLIVFSACSKEVATPDVEETTTPGNAVIEDAQIVDEEAKENENTDAETGIVTFNLVGENFKFIMNGSEAPDLRVKLGDTVRIEFTSKDGFHDWVVDEFDAATKQVQTGDNTSVEFVADQAGTFEYYCSVGQHRANGMRGNLIVE